MDCNASVALPAAPHLALPISRRRLLQTALAASLAAAVGSGLTALPQTTAVPFFGLRRADYTPWLGHPFRLVPPEGGPIRARLHAIEDLGVAHRYGLKGSQDAFILLFQARAGAPELGQAVMRVHLPGGGTRELLMTPAGPPGGAVRYAAVINRFVPSGGRPRV